MQSKDLGNYECDGQMDISDFLDDVKQLPPDPKPEDYKRKPLIYHMGLSAYYFQCPYCKAENSEKHSTEGTYCSRGEDMKKRIIRAAIAAVFILSLLIIEEIEAQSRVAKIDPVVGDPFKEPVKIRCTCYCEHGVTGTGKKTRYGIVAGRKEWLGYTAELNAIMFISRL